MLDTHNLEHLSMLQQFWRDRIGNEEKQELITNRSTV
jgi:hypothetical protein